MSDKNLEQWIIIRFCVKIGKSASETLALLTVAYVEYAMKKSSIFEWHRRFKEGRENGQNDPKSGQPKTQRTGANMERVHCTRKTVNQQCYLEMLTGLRESVQRKTPQYGLTNGVSTMAMPLRMMCQKFASSWLRNPLQKWTIHLVHLNKPPAMFSSFQN
jgi:hypothetical protein